MTADETEEIEEEVHEQENDGKAEDGDDDELINGRPVSAREQLTCSEEGNVPR